MQLLNAWIFYLFDLSFGLIADDVKFLGYSTLSVHVETVDHDSLDAAVASFSVHNEHHTGWFVLSELLLVSAWLFRVIQLVVKEFLELVPPRISIVFGDEIGNVDNGDKQLLEMVLQVAYVISSDNN